MRKSTTQIKKEADTLEAMKLKVRQFTAFGEDNHKRIEAQITVLRENLDEDDIDDKWPPEDDYDLNECARNAMDWINCCGDVESLSGDWKPLVNK